MQLSSEKEICLINYVYQTASNFSGTEGGENENNALSLKNGRPFHWLKSEMV